MTLKLNRDLNILKMYLQTENEVLSIQNINPDLEQYENSSQG